jgi:hypothetical protein
VVVHIAMIELLIGILDEVMGLYILFDPQIILCQHGIKFDDLAQVHLQMVIELVVLNEGMLILIIPDQQ